MFKNSPIDQSAFVVLYPDKIIIDTRNTSGEGAWHSTDNVSILAVDVPDKDLGEAILKHLQRSRFETISPALVRDYRKRYRKATKLKTEKSVMENASAISVFRSSKMISIEPKNNKFPISGEKYFFGIPSPVSSCALNVDSE